jgi:hypothetical protein
MQYICIFLWIKDYPTRHCDFIERTAILALLIHMQIIWLQHVAACRQGKVKQVYINSKYGYSILLDTINLFDSNTVHSKCINDHTLRSDIFLPKCPTHSREMSDKFESTLSKSDYLVGRRGRTWEWIFKDFVCIFRGEHVKHFVIDAYL